MIDLMHIYNHLPPSIQNVGVSLYGYYLRRQRYGGNFREYISEIQKNQWLTIEELKEVQRQHLQSIVSHTYKNVPYYKDLFDKEGLVPSNIKSIEDLREIPILEKETLRRIPEEFIARNFKKSALLKEHTGGTTGTPLTIYATREAIQFNYTMSEARIRNWYGTKLSDTTAAFLGKPIVPINQKHPPFWRYNKAWNEYLFSIFHMAEENLKFYIAKLREIHPTIIVGYPTPVYILARLINKDHLEGAIKPKLIWLSSETLQDYQRNAIERAFATKVCNAYSQAELTAFISECPEGGLHISPEYGVVEFVPVKGGENERLYEVIATGLFNYAMPFIRYRTGDIVMLTERKCPCGRELPLVGKIIGRNDSVLITPQGTCISSAPLSLVFEFCSNVEEAQIIQDVRDHITVRIMKRKSYGPRDEEYLRSELCKRIGTEVRIDFDYVTEIKRTNIGKYRFLISEVANEEIG